MKRWCYLKVLRPEIAALVMWSMRQARGSLCIHQFPLAGLTCVWFRD